MITRRKFLAALAASGAAVPVARGAGLEPQRAIDRAALVRRHDPVLRKLDPLSPLSVGNGEFAFTADVTGLQTFPEEYESLAPLCTMSQWGWHTTPRPAGLEGKELRLTAYDTYGRDVLYHTRSEGQKELYDWLRENPHRLHLGRVGLHMSAPGRGAAKPSDITDIEQRLDLWAGILTSRFRVWGEPVTVRTAVHPRAVLLAVSIESSLIAREMLAVRFAFPYGSPTMQAADWRSPKRHRTEVVRHGRDVRHGRGVLLRRRLDDDEYFALIDWAGVASLDDEEEGGHGSPCGQPAARASTSSPRSLLYPSAARRPALRPRSTRAASTGRASGARAAQSNWRTVGTSGRSSSSAASCSRST